MTGCHAHMIFALTQQIFYALSALFYCALCLSLLESLQEAFSTSLSILVSTISVTFNIGAIESATNSYTVSL